jgi:hypothetical protein
MIIIFSKQSVVVDVVDVITVVSAIPIDVAFDGTAVGCSEVRWLNIVLSNG